jgi:hypothetical protein
VELWLFLGFVVLSLVIWYRGDQRSARIVHEWAERHGYAVSSLRRKWLWPGRFLFRSTSIQRVYDVTVIDKNGRYLHAQVRVGNWFLGALLDEVRVEWIDP